MSLPTEETNMLLVSMESGVSARWYDDSVSLVSAFVVAERLKVKAS